jgi:hypothetical protein
MRTFIIAGTIVALAGPALAQTADCPLPYPVFEFAVPHIDLDTCPAEVAAEGAFCRASIANDALHVFVFAEDGEQCLRDVVSLTEEDFGIMTH